MLLPDCVAVAHCDAPRERTASCEATVASHNVVLRAGICIHVKLQECRKMLLYSHS